MLPILNLYYLQSNVAFISIKNIFLSSTLTGVEVVYTIHVFLKNQDEE